MKTLLLLSALMLSAAAVPAFAQADNDIASKLQQGHDYSKAQAAKRRAARARRHHTPPAHSANDIWLGQPGARVVILPA